MSTLTLDIPPAVAKRLEDAPIEKAAAARAAAIEALIDSLERATPEEIITGALPERNYITFEEHREQQRAFWKAKGINYDALVAEADPVIEDE